MRLQGLTNGRQGFTNRAQGLTNGLQGLTKSTPSHEKSTPVAHNTNVFNVGIQMGRAGCNFSRLSQDKLDRLISVIVNYITMDGFVRGNRSQQSASE